MLVLSLKNKDKGMIKVFKITLKNGESFIDYTELSKLDIVYFYSQVNPFNPVRALKLLKVLK